MPPGSSLASGTGPIVPIAAGAMAMAIFALDTTTHLEIAAGVFYVAVVLMVVRAFERRAVLFVSGACIALAVSSHLLTREGPLSVTGLVNLGIGTSAIAIVTYLALRNQSAERALTDQFRLVIDTIPTFAWRTRPDGYAEFFSRRWQDYTGLSLEQTQGWGWTEALHPDDVAGLTEAWRASLETGSPAETEARMRRSDGAYRWFLFRAEPLRDGRGAVVNWYGTYTDIEDRKRAEALLREQAGLLDLTHDTIFVRDLKNVITYWNRGAEERYGWPREQALGNSSHQLMQTIFPAPLEEITAELYRTGRWEGELVHAKRDGTRVVVASRWSLQRDERGNPLATLETNNDITECKRAEDALRESEEQWKAAFENNPTMYFMVDEAGTVLSVNSFGAEQLGYGVDELIGRPVLDVFYEADRETVQRNVAICLEQLGRSMRWELRKIRRDGAVLWVRETGRAMSIKTRPVVLIACEDITERKRAEDELWRSQAYLAEGQRLSHTGTFGWTVSSGELYWSDETYRIFEYDRTEQPTLELVLQRTHPEDVAFVLQATDVAQHESGFDLEHRLLMPDGRVKYLHVVANASERDQAGDREFVGAVMDITARKRNEQRLTAQYAVTRVLAESDSLATAAAHLLAAIGESLEWDWGALWTVDRQGARLRCDDIWHGRDIETGEFDAVSRELAFTPGKGRVGQVWRSALPTWMVDATTEGDFLRGSAAASAGLHGAVEFPILLSGQALGVVEFFSRTARERDEEQLTMLLAIGSQIGQFLTRKRAEAELRASERRYRYIFQAAGVSIWEEDFSRVKTALDELKAAGVRDFTQYLADHPEFVRQAISW